MNVKAFKFINGEEVLAEIVRVSDAAITVKNPLTTAIVKGPDGSPTLAFGQWSFIAKEDQEYDIIVTSLLVLPMDVHEEVKSSYEQNFSSIILPPTKPTQILHG